MKDLIIYLWIFEGMEIYVSDVCICSVYFHAAKAASFIKLSLNFEQKDYFSRKSPFIIRSCAATPVVDLIRVTHLTVSGEPGLEGDLHEVFQNIFPLAKVSFAKGKMLGAGRHPTGPVWGE